MKPSRTVAALMLTWTAATSTACYRYVPLQSDAPPLSLGEEVRAYLSEPDRVRLQHVTAENVVRVDGEFVDQDDSRLVLSAFWLKAGTGLEFKGVGETVELKRSSITTVERKKFSAIATAVVSAALVAVAVLGGVALGGGGFGSEPPGTIPPER